MNNDKTLSLSEDDEGLFLKLKKWFKEDKQNADKWAAHAKEDYAFYNGKQWSDEDVAALKEQSRPVMTFNRVAPLVNAITGSEINNRREVRYIPREIGDGIANELLTGAGEWFRDQAEAEDEDSEAFQDAVICGMGWTDTRLDFDNNPEGDPLVQRLDPLKMVWDHASVKPNLTDARRMWYVDEKPLEDVKAMFPDVDVELLHAAWAQSGEGDSEAHNQAQSGFYSGEKKFVKDRKKVTIVECRYFDYEFYYRAADLQTGEIKEYSKDELEHILNANQGLPHVRQKRKVVKRVFIGAKILDKPDQPLVPNNLFGWECITGYFDKTDRFFYGVVRPAKDPQRWSNKFFSQVMYLLNSQSKGGIMAERGAFDDDNEAAASWAKADSVTWTAQGALAGGRIQPKPAAQFPSGFFTLFNEAKEAITQVTGLSAEFIGTREVNQAGVLESQRRQSSLNLLASLFNSLRRYRKRQGETILYLIQNYLSDGRLIRIVGEEKSQYVPLTREQIANKTYDIIVDDAPTSPNEKERTFAIVQQILPMLRDYMTPEIGLELLKYSPLPASMVDKLTQSAQKMEEQRAQQPQQSPEEQAKLQEIQMDIQSKQAKADIDNQAKGIDLMVKQRIAEMDVQIAQQKAEIEQQKISNEIVANDIRAQRVHNQRVNAAI